MKIQLIFDSGINFKVVKDLVTALEQKGYKAVLDWDAHITLNKIDKRKKKEVEDEN